MQCWNCFSYNDCDCLYLFLKLTSRVLVGSTIEEAMIVETERSLTLTCKVEKNECLRTIQYILPKRHSNALSSIAFLTEEEMEAERSDALDRSIDVEDDEDIYDVICCRLQHATVINASVTTTFSDARLYIHAEELDDTSLFLCIAFDLCEHFASIVYISEEEYSKQVFSRCGSPFVTDTSSVIMADEV